ncbi:DNA alkylation repair protein [Treponema phagedenis]|uniref:DNA alkylation repair protein n=1 Tax=Treponema phagedenis TaxID=162 RepID=A0AAE6IVJ5_TREPH|nr:DNA alkylation repair protein [Treponema phagedenis]NVP23170.1 DNA alkylation repair protein [Treponema phagedenis]QEJ98022.1 DNA alkylation repair protein [Treponema phagedenis]QEK03529.1 DNA alkylation repair protein [Treponema phagedenis]QEK05747.1 DNA alkylation repair protein [Treponema phagedenis]QEK09155.1 DNA alkylation repair protein [Treponema phagedenis]
MNKIQTHLFSLQDKTYAEFSRKLMPTVNPETVIGVRTPDLRKFAKELVKQNAATEFLLSLPHTYFEENQLHALILAQCKDFTALMPQVESFLSYIDNWATCDVFSPKIFKKHLQALLPHIRKWLTAKHTYTVRFAVGMLMEYYLDDAFETQHSDMVAAIRSEEYYVNMMIAWYFATALVKQWEHALPYLQEKKLQTWTHNKTIQKAVESYRIAPEQKIYLKTLKR